MNRFNLKEMNFGRVTAALLRRFIEVPDAVMWMLPGKYAEHKRLLSNYYNKHQGERCFILANGPSLADMDLSVLKNEITFGMNRIYMLFDKMNFLPTYYVCVNELILEQFHNEITSLTMQKFLNWNRRQLFPDLDLSFSYLKMSLALRDSFVKDLAAPIFSGGTVTYVTLQIAFLMGFRTVVLVGLDHSFAEKSAPNKVEIRKTEIDVNHFHPDYFPKGIKWQLPDLMRSELAYALARRVYESDGRKIIDATVNGKCNVFEKKDYQLLIETL